SNTDGGRNGPYIENRDIGPTRPEQGMLTRAEIKILSGGLLDQSYIAGLSGAELRILRNVIYARHGWRFDSQDLQRYFASKPWYRVRSEYTDKDLTSNDRENLNIILNAEKGGADGGSASGNVSGAEKEIQATLDGWAAALRAHDLDRQMSYYTSTLDVYYRR